MNRIAVSAILLMLLAASAAAQDFSIASERLSERVLVVRIDENNNVVAVATDDGIVLVDSFACPAFAKQGRELIEKEFGRSDFAHVILTHHHVDHTGGNQVFPEAHIIGHQFCLEAFTKQAAEMPEMVARYRQVVESERARLAALDAGSGQAKFLIARIAHINAVFEDIAENFEAVPPDICFSDRMSLYVGGLEIELIYYGPSHSGNDILVHIPAEGLLMVGDLFDWEIVPYLSNGHGKADPVRWLAVLDEVLSNETAVKYVVPGHEAMLTRDDMLLRRDYIRDIWSGILAARAEGLTLEEAQRRMAFDSAFSRYASLQYVYGGENIHEGNIEFIWNAAFEEERHLGIKNNSETINRIDERF